MHIRAYTIYVHMCPYKRIMLKQGSYTQVGVKVTAPGKKNPLRQSTGLAAGARPVYKMYARPSCVSLWSFNFHSLLTTNSITSKTRNLGTQVWAIALIAVSPPNFPWISCSFHLHSIQLRSPPPVTLHFLGNSYSDRCNRSKCAASLHLLELLQVKGLIFRFPFQAIGHAKVD